MSLIRTPILCSFRLAVCLFALFSLAPAQAALRLTEFLAANDNGLTDSDGDNSDWIELHNDSSTAVSLAGWHLTDSPNELTRWTFPDTQIPARGYLVVFASGKDRRVTGRELHTNFQLSSDGEFLALVEPDGLTIAHSYHPAFPLQQANVSYGVLTRTNNVTLISSGNTAYHLVPADDALGTNWLKREFTATDWATGPTPLGYNNGKADTNTVGETVLQVDFNDDDMGETGAANSEAGFQVMTLNNNPASLNGLTLTLSTLNSGVLDDRDRPTPTESLPHFSLNQIYDDFIFVDSTNHGAGLRLQIEKLSINRDYQLTLWSFDSWSASNRVSQWSETASGITNVLAENYTFDGRISPVNDEAYSFTKAVRSSPSGQLTIEGTRTGGIGQGVFLNGLRLVELGSQFPLNTDVATAMSNHNASIYLRVPFVVTNASDLLSLHLRMKYDDGFIAYLNGQLIAARNAPGSPGWNATALDDGGSPFLFEDIALTNAHRALQEGTNVLAIHGLNRRADDADFLIVPELTGTRIENEPRYFSVPTPGTANNAGFIGLVADTKFSVNRGFYEVPFSVSITSATPGAQIYWTTNGSIPSPANGMLYTAPLPITKTTLLRAAAFRSDFLPSNTDTHTYIFLDQVLQQPSVQPGYPTTWQASYPADYGMDPNVVNHPAYSGTIKQDLRAIPTLSIVAPHNDLWHPSTGIYVDATREGESWERAASIELFAGDGTTLFQEDCGIQMQGNASRDNGRTPKHAFRLMFKSRYGASKLNYDWFNSEVTEFDNIVLRACFSDSWSTRSSPGDGGARYRPDDSLYLRDIWVKDSLADMGHLSGRGSFVHLYVNGLYWGLYNPTERLDATYFSEHIGGAKEDWDVIRDFSEVLDGSKAEWNRMMTLVNAGIDTEAKFQAVAAEVDITSLIDYMVLHIFSEVEDWPHHNWYAARKRATNDLPATKWIFLAWDQEISLDQLVRRNRINVSDNDTPARIYSQLRNWPEFRRMFGDRVHKHLFNDGALTPTHNINRLKARAAQVREAVVGESARWGDAREFTIGPNPGTGKTFTRDEYWLPELDKLYTNFFPKLTAENIARFRTGNLYPNVSAPEFSQFGGRVAAGFELTLTHTNTTGTIYYTTDGSDPRVYGTGVVSPNAQTYSAPVTLNRLTTVKARVLRNGIWSALTEATFQPPQDFSSFFITEIMYHPPDDGTIDGAEFEFLEFQNQGTNTLDLSGLRFSAGIEFTFPASTLLAPNEFLLLGRNAELFSNRYPGKSLNGINSGRLDNAGETLTIEHPVDGVVLTLNYDDTPPWPTAADGSGASLQRWNFSGSASQATNWIAALPTPGAPLTVPDSDGDGMPDEWEQTHNTLVNFNDADADPDGDGSSNLQEYLAGTHPNDVASALQIEKATLVNGELLFEFTAVSNRSYSLISRAELLGGEWQVLHQVVAHPTNRVEIITLPDPVVGPRYYRIITPAHP